MPCLAGPYKASCDACGWHLIVFRQTPDYIQSPDDLPLRILCPTCGVETQRSNPSLIEIMNPLERLRWLEYCGKHGLRP